MFAAVFCGGGRIVPASRGDYELGEKRPTCCLIAQRLVARSASDAQSKNLPLLPGSAPPKRIVIRVKILLGIVLRHSSNTRISEEEADQMPLAV